MPNNPTPPKPSTLRMRRRIAILDALAFRMTGFHDETWSTFSTQFSRIVPEHVSGPDLTQKVIALRIIEILKSALKNAEIFAVQTGQADDIVKILASIPRQSKVGRQSKKHIIKKRTPA